VLVARPERASISLLPIPASYPCFLSCFLSLLPIPASYPRAPRLRRTQLLAEFQRTVLTGAGRQFVPRTFCQARQMPRRNLLRLPRSTQDSFRKFKDTEKVVSSMKRDRARCTIEVTRRRQYPCLEEFRFHRQSSRSIASAIESVRDKPVRHDVGKARKTTIDKFADDQAPSRTGARPESTAFSSTPNSAWSGRDRVRGMQIGSYCP
jgi:hypothetical protein